MQRNHIVYDKNSRWPNGVPHTSCAGGREFESRVSQILHSRSKGLPLLLHHSALVALALRRGDGHRKLVTRFGVIQQV